MIKQILSLLFFVSLIAAQPLIQQESRLFELEKEQILMQNKLDSLKIKLEWQLQRIDQLKSEKDRDKDEIASQMSRALTISKTIEKYESALKVNKTQQQQAKVTLRNRYTFLIDSLQNSLENAKNEQDRQKTELRILLIADKRMRISSFLQPLSFDPQKIKEINLNKTSSNLERAIYKNYLELALADIDSHLTVVGNKRDELEEIIRLEKKAEAFIGDIEDNKIFGFYEESEPPLQENAPKPPFIDYPRSIQADPVTANEFQIIFKQIHKSVSEIGVSDMDKYLFSIDKSMSRQEYFELLKKTYEYLELYRKVIINKLSAR